MEDDYLAYCIDDAVAYFGNMLETEVSNVEADNQMDRRRKTQMIYDKYFKDPEDAPTKGLFADPAALVR